MKECETERKEERETKVFDSRSEECARKSQVTGRCNESVLHIGSGLVSWMRENGFGMYHPEVKQ